MQNSILREDTGIADFTPVDAALERINSLIAPIKNTGELIILGRAKSNPRDVKELYHATFKDGKGYSCCEKKVTTLVNHGDYDWTGAIPKEIINDETEVPWYGALSIKNIKNLGDSDWSECIIGFSDRDEWQDCLFVIGVLKALEESLKVKFTLPDNIKDDKCWGTFLRLKEYLG